MTDSSLLSTYQSSCGNYMWNKILLSDSTSKLISDTSAYKESYNGIFSMHGGDYQSTGDTLLNNRYHVQMMPYSGQQPSTFDGSWFDCDKTTMLNPYLNRWTEAAIKVHKVQNFIFGDSLNDTNTVKNSVVGIYGYQSGLEVYKNHFEKFHTNPITKNYPNYLSSGIRIRGDSSLGSSQNDYIQVGGAGKSNLFKNMYSGVLATYDHSLSVESNDFTSLTLGVYIRGCDRTNLEINNNEIQNSTIGIMGVANSFSDLSINSNEIGGTNYSVNDGIVINDYLPAVLDSADSAQTKCRIKDNTIYASQDGIEVTATPNARVNSNEIRVRVTQSQPADGFDGIRLNACKDFQVKNNDIRGTNAGNNATAEAKGIQINQSREGLITCNELYYFFQDLYFQQDATPVSIGKNDFHGAVSANDSTYGVYCQNNGLIGSQGSTGNPTGDSWDGSYFSKGKFVADSTKLGNKFWYVRNTTLEDPSGEADGRNGGTVISFQTTSGTPEFSCSNGPVGNSSGVTYQAIANDDVSYNDDDGFSTWIAEQFLFGKLSAYPDLKESDSTYINFFDSLENSNIDYIRRSYDAIANLNGDQIDCSSHLSPENKMDTTHEDVMPRLADFLNYGDDYLGETDSSEVESIALRCPQKWGLAVHQARTMVLAWDPEREFSDDCESGGEKRKTPDLVNNKENDEGISFQYWPNPTSGEVRCRVSQGGGVINVQDIYGRQILRMELEPETTHTNFNLENLSGGVYYIHYQYKGKIHDPGKLILAR